MLNEVNILERTNEYNQKKSRKIARKKPFVLLCRTFCFPIQFRTEGLFWSLHILNEKFCNILICGTNFKLEFNDQIFRKIIKYN